MSRGGAVESRHLVHVVVADERGRTLLVAGDAALGTFYRSAAKPFQALPLVEDGVVEHFALEPAELALAAASHGAEPRHLAVARSLLAKAGAEERDLACGPHLPLHPEEAEALLARGERPGRLHNNCSGKHAGMLALAAFHGWPAEGYHLSGHPVQQRMLAEVARWTGMEATDIGTGVDGCGVVCFRVPLDRMAASFARFGAAAARGERAARVVQAMTGHPFMVGGTGRLCTALMERTGERVFVKTGAEGVYGAGLPARGIGIALKVEDGAKRAADAALLLVLERLGALDDADLEALAAFGRPSVMNTRGEVVGSLGVGSGPETP